MRIYVGSYPDLPEISPLAAVDTLLIRTHAWRCKDEQKASLLLTSTGLHNPPSPDTVARWIKDILVEASPNLKAKDVRSLAAFYAQNSGIDLSTNLAMENWSSHGVYQQFYRRGVMSMLQKNQITQGILTAANKRRNNKINTPQ